MPRSTLVGRPLRARPNPVGRSPRARRWLAVLALAVLAESVGLVVTPHAPPIYDGIGFPDEPYRFVQPPAGYRHTQPPTTATDHLTVSDGRTVGGRTVNSAENGPQVSLYFPSGAIDATGAGTVTVAATPVAATGAAVPGHLWGNVYRVTLTADAGTPGFAPGARAEIQLRAPSPQQPGPTFYLRRGSTWSALTTHRTGNDFYQADLAATGDYALASDHVLNLNAKNPNDEGNVGILGFVISGVAVAVVIVLFVRAERRGSRRRRSGARPGSAG